MTTRPANEACFEVERRNDVVRFQRDRCEAFSHNLSSVAAQRGKGTRQ